MPGESNRRVYFHIDLDAFYASVEQRDNPDLKGRPVIIGALPGHRGVVAACSYEARKFGVRSAMPIGEAYARCPKGSYLTPRMERYQEVSRSVMRVFRDFSPAVHQISIDEATLDMTGTERLFGSPEHAAGQVKEQVRAQCGLILSVGIAPNRYLAKLASEFDKPDGLFEVLPGEEESFIDRLELKDLWGLGKRSLERLTEIGITTIPGLRGYPLDLLTAMLGDAAGRYLYRVVRGQDPGIYSETPRSRSVSSELTFEHDTRDPETIDRVLLDLSHQVMFRLLDEQFVSKTVNLKLRFADFTTTTAQTTMRRPVISAEEIYAVARELLLKRWNGTELIRLVGVGMSALQSHSDSDAPQQGELFEAAYDRKSRVERAVFEITKKHERDAVVKATLLRERTRRSRSPGTPKTPGTAQDEGTSH